MIGKPPNVLPQCDFVLAGPDLTHNLHWHWLFHNEFWERLQQKSIPVGNVSVGGCRAQNLVYNLQLAKRLGVSKSKANISNLHLCLDVNTSFVIYVNCFWRTQHLKLQTINAFFLTHVGQILVRTGSVHVLVYLQRILELSQADVNRKWCSANNLKSHLFSCNTFFNILCVIYMFNSQHIAIDLFYWVQDSGHITWVESI